MMSRKDIFRLIIIIAVVALAVIMVNVMETAHRDSETRLVQDAIRNAALTCYAVEGAFPEDVEYLRRHYSLHYNEERYFVTFETFAPNIMPGIIVTEKGAKAP